MRLVGHIRVSTAGQAEHGLGLEVQERAIRKWAMGHNHRLTAVTADEGVSGTKEVADRPGLHEALAFIEGGRADGIVVYRLDRLARLLTVQEAALAQIWSHGGRCFTVDGGEVLQDDPDDPMRTAMRQMIGVFAQLEKGMISARMRAGRRLKADKGGYAFGAPPLGKRAEKGVLHSVPDEQEVIERITELRRSGASYRRIAAVLDEEGRRTKRGGRWHPTTLARICERIDQTGTGGQGQALSA